MSGVPQSHIAVEQWQGQPRVPLATLPTPLEKGPELTGGSRLWVKRDDLTGLGMGGNKVRKLEFLRSSNHCWVRLFDYRWCRAI